MRIKTEIKYWGKRFVKWVVSVGDFIEKWKIIHATGTIILAAVATHDGFQTKAKNTAEAKVDTVTKVVTRVRHERDSLKRKADSCTVEIINNRRYPQ